MTSSISITPIEGQLAMARAFAVLALALALALAPNPVRVAFAQGLDENALREASDAAFHKGKELAAAGQWGEACAKFDESVRLLARGGAQQRLAHCLETIGQDVNAWYAFERALGFARKDENKARQDFALAHLKALEAKLTLLVVRWGGARSASVSLWVDGHPIEVQGDAPVVLEPGAHALRVVAGGRVRWEQSIVTTAGERRTFELLPFVNMLVAPGAPDDPATAPAHETGSPRVRSAAGSGKGLSSAPEPSAREGDGLLRWVGWSALGVGVGALGVGTFFGARALRGKSQSERQCPNGVCNDEGWELWNEGRSAATVANVMLPAGALCAAGGVALIILAPSTPRAKAGAGAQLRVAPSLMLGAAALGVSGTW
jgi:hypothetical protein